jgi:hypothetical protein
VNELRAARAFIIGVHPIDAPEPVHLVELSFAGAAAELNFGAITQPDAARPPSEWQVPYDEHVLKSQAGRTNVVFFFHYLDLARPLETPFGPLALPAETPMPQRLRGIRYAAP